MDSGIPPPDLNDPILNQIRLRLVRSVDPKRIILFGSRARGDATDDSDYDLLIVTRADCDPERIGERAHGALMGCRVSKDLVVVTPEELATYSKRLSSIVRSALEEGIVIHEAA
jgi:uncharacterized protein